MGKRGPKAQKSADTSSVLVGYLKPDRDLSKEAKAVWRQLVASMDPGFYTEIDRGLLRLYCREYARYEAAFKQLEVEGEIVDINGQPKINPLYLVMMRAADSTAKWQRQLKACKSALETHRSAAKASQAGATKAKSGREHLMFNGGEVSEDTEKILN